MYREAQEVLAPGLSRGAAISLGIVATLTCVGMAAMAPSSNSPIGFYLFAAFCGAIAIACFTSGKIRRMVGRLLGATVFVFSACYFLNELSDGPLISGRRSQPSILNAAIFLIVAGIPGLLYALLGRFSWRHGTGEPSEP